MNIIQKSKDHKTQKISVLFLCLFFMSILIIKSSYVSKAFSEGLYFGIKKVVPSLFPFIIATQILISSGGISVLTEMLEKRTSNIKININTITPCLIGLLCGFPIGAKCTRELYEQAKISKQEADVLLIGANCASPAFVISAIGEGMLNSKSTGVAIWLMCTSTSLLLTYFLLPKGKLAYKNSNHVSKNDKSNTNILTRSLTCAAASMINIIMLIGMFYLLCKASIDILEYFNASNTIKASVAAIIEMCVGCKSACEYLPEHKDVLCAFSIGFGGLSTCFQVRAEAHTNAKITKYVISKLVCGLICAIFVFLYCKN